MPKIQAGSITMNYDQQGSGEPLVLIPYLAADYACYAFQVAEYSKHFTGVSVDLRGTGESDKQMGERPVVGDQCADDVADHHSRTLSLISNDPGQAIFSGLPWFFETKSEWRPQTHISPARARAFFALRK
jgi:pimeloyl-ACP methyl ester carboxylesterase